MGDNYAYEKEQERDAQHRALHKPMKKWFKADEGGLDLKGRFGGFPLFWQDLKDWPHFKEVHRVYLGATGAAPPAPPPPGAAAAAPGAAAPGAAAPASGADGSAAAIPKRKRKSRWGNSSDAAAPAAGAAGAAGAADAGSGGQGGSKRGRKFSRWSSETEARMVDGVQIPAGLTPDQQHLFVLRVKMDTVNRRMLTVQQDAAVAERDPNRSPSPPPTYDSNGKRTNARVDRMRKRIEDERNGIIKELVKINPMFKPPGWEDPDLKRRMYVPVKDFPGYNFIGLIIGPRGNTQKRMERETQCKIAIRGKGSVKEGRAGRRDGRRNPDEDDELHVLVTGPSKDQVDRACQMVAELLAPVDDTHNVHKQKQLRELALINGTLREETFCTLCGEPGHKQYECPNKARNTSFANITCAICGESSHATRDCPNKDRAREQSAQMDSEYKSFMAELGEGPAGAGGGGGGGGGGRGAGAGALFCPPVGPPGGVGGRGANGQGGQPSGQGPPPPLPPQAQQQQQQQQRRQPLPPPQQGGGMPPSQPPPPSAYGGGQPPPPMGGPPSRPPPPPHHQQPQQHQQHRQHQQQPPPHMPPGPPPQGGPNFGPPPGGPYGMAPPPPQVRLGARLLWQHEHHR